MNTEAEELEEDVDERQSLEEKVDKLLRTLNRLEDDFSEYESRVSRMIICKLTDPRYPFTAWELLVLHNQDRQKRFRAVMTALQNRLDGKETPAVEQLEFDDIPKDVLYAASKPSYAEAVDILKRVGEVGDASLMEVMNAITDEYDIKVEFGGLADFVLAGIHFGERPA